MAIKKIGNKKFGILIKALHGEVDIGQRDFVHNLFSVVDVRFNLPELEGLLKNWMAGKNKSYQKHFKGIEFKPEHDESFIKFLDEKIKMRFPNIQKSLREYESDFCYIDFETDSSAIFFKSVLDQFKDIVGLPLGKTVGATEWNGNSIGNNGKTFQSGTPSEQMLRIFKLAIFDCNIDDFFLCCQFCPTASDSPIRFLEIIKTEIEGNELLREHRDEEMYQNIIRFAYTLDHYNRALNTREHTVVSSYHALDVEIAYLYKTVVALYGEICSSGT